MKQYRIGDFAKYLGVTPDLLKHYEDMGIIQSQRSESGYRYYPFHTTRLLIESIRLRNYGLTLREIREILNGHSMDNAQMESLFTQNLSRLREEILLDEALAADYEDFLIWKQNWEARGWDWEIRRSRPVCFLPHTDGYDFLEDPRIYEILNDWMSYVPIVKSTMRMEPDGRVTWGFSAEESTAARLKLPQNEVVEHIPSQRIFYYKFRGDVLRTTEERPDNPENQAFRQLRALGLRHAGTYYRTSLMPGDWKQGLRCQYGYYAIPLCEED